MRSFLYIITISTFLIGFSGCSDTDVKSSSERVEMHRDATGAPMILYNELSLSLRPGYSIRRIAARTHWVTIGSIPQGQLYKTIDTALMVFGGQASDDGLGSPYTKYDSYLVVKDGSVVGVYLPTKSAFVVASSPFPISLKEN